MIDLVRLVEYLHYELNLTLDLSVLLCLSPVFYLFDIGTIGVLVAVLSLICGTVFPFKHRCRRRVENVRF